MVSYDLRDLGISAAIEVTGFTMGIVLLLVIYQVCQYLRANYYRQAQVRLLGVLIAPLVLGGTSWIHMFVGPEDILNSIVVLYKAIFLISFMEYLLCLLAWGSGEEPPFSRDEEKMLERLVRLEHVDHSCRCFGKISVSTPELAKKFISRMRIMTYQTIVIFILTLITGIVLSFTTDLIEPGNYDVKLALFWIDLVRSLAFGLSFYHSMILLGVFSRLKEFDTSVKNNIYLPFLIILITVPEPLIVGVLADSNLVADTEEYDSDDISVFTYSLLVIVEMLVFGFLQNILLPIKHLARSPDENGDMKRSLL